MSLSKQGRTADEIREDLATRHDQDLPTHGGRTWAYVYDSGVEELTSLLNDALVSYSSVNMLDPTVFPSIVDLEKSVVGAGLGLLGGGPDGVESAVGVVTSGGTESCVLSVKAARDYQDPNRTYKTKPNIVVAESVHPAFRKGAHYFSLDVITVPVDPVTFRPEPGDFAKAINSDTVMVVVSAPSYAHGVVDPVAEVAQIAEAVGVLCQVDSCIGGWLLPYWRASGEPIPAFDFTIPGVTSISVDLHKYAYTSKGVSLLLFRDDAVRRSCYFASASWPGYYFVNSTMQSTKSAGPLAAAWAGLQYLGDDGYAELAAQTLDATKQIASGIAAIPGLRVLGDTDSALVAFTVDETDVAADNLDIYVVADELRQLGWYVQPQPRAGDLPSNIHLTVTAASLPNVDKLLADVPIALEAAREHGPAVPPKELLDFAHDLRPEALTPDMLEGLLSIAGFNPSGASDARQAIVNHLLDELPLGTRETLLKHFLSYIYS